MPPQGRGLGVLAEKLESRLAVVHRLKECTSAKLTYNVARLMQSPMRFRSVLFALALTAAAHATSFVVTFPATAFSGKFTGRVVLYLSESHNQPRFGPNWFNPEPMFSQAFKDIAPKEPMRFSSAATGFPSSMSKLKPGDYYVQAVIDRNLGGRAIGSSPGNLYSSAVRATVNPAADNEVQIVCDKVVAAPIFKETPVIKEAQIESKLLTKFYGRPTFMKAAVFLPENWELEQDKKFPIYYEVPGFGGTSTDWSGSNFKGRTKIDGENFLFVVLDPECPTGHHVFADSANNGPWGKALTTEFIPFIEKAFRAIGSPGARYVGGHSSGGWSSLWLQVTYPDIFGGCWSTSPDPVDFRDFQRINLYENNINMFVDSAGKPRPIARFGDEPALFYRQFSDMERPIRGEQLGSFEAAFSPKGSDGQPMKLWDRDTGAVNHDVAEAWKKYDIDFILRKNWKVLEPRLRGKVHVYMGNMDTFYLEGAVKLLKKDVAELAADPKHPSPRGTAPVIELFPGDHGTVMTRELVARIHKEIADSYRAWKAKQ